MAFYSIKETNSNGITKYKCRVREKSAYYPHDSSRTFDSYDDAIDFGESEKLRLGELVQQSKQKGVNTKVVSAGHKILFTNAELPKLSEQSTLREFVEELLKEHERSPKSFAKSTASALKHIIGNTTNDGYKIANIKVIDITYQTLEQFCRERLSLGIKPQTVKLDLSALAKAIGDVSAQNDHLSGLSKTQITQHFELLGKRGYIAKSGTRFRRLKKGEYRKILRAFWKRQQSSRVTENYVSLIVLYIELTVRRSELLELTWSDVDFENNLITITPNKPRSGEPNAEDRLRQMPLWGLAKKVLKKLKPINVEPNAKIFNIKPGTITSKFGVIVRLLAIDDLRLHDLRREGVSRLLEQGFTKEQVKVFTGHKDSRMIDEVYQNIDARNVVANVERLQNFQAFTLQAQLSTLNKQSE
ncbi:tyrosine-type recombinase/integrase [Pseudoalteromonas sp. 2CM28B]|uniref:tyrosine-type recombinase/integrase n=1 Tax=Pseudoalteromonas sp. 2CM28B TaxID=2929851 RepID=UPI0020BE3FF7|nr:tyrosine-type recombinase/integrase [Pseudoalteromonas sp. 2CM28B]MCK8134707.1 tyrosine-type recombinase/integrase [Pseudoalteromonas sp. 2CM28B]